MRSRGRGRGRARIVTNSSFRYPAPTTPVNSPTSLVFNEICQPLQRISQLISKPFTAEFNRGSPQGETSRVYTPTLWDVNSIFGCFWLNNQTQNLPTEVDVVLNLFLVATLISQWNGYTGINQVVNLHASKVLNQFSKKVNKGSSLVLFVQKLCWMESVPSVLVISLVVAHLGLTHTMSIEKDSLKNSLKSSLNQGSYSNSLPAVSLMKFKKVTLDYHVTGVETCCFLGYLENLRLKRRLSHPREVKSKSRVAFNFRKANEKKPDKEGSESGEENVVVT